MWVTSDEIWQLKRSLMISNGTGQGSSYVDNRLLEAIVFVLENQKVGQ